MKSAPSICQKEFLTHTMNFGIGSTFSKGPGSAFSQGSGPGLGPLYKVFQSKQMHFSKKHLL